MSLFQKRSAFSNPVSYYTSNLNKTILLVGLGNPGKEYDLTRHNIGFEAVEAFTKGLEEFDSWTSKKDLKCLLTSAQLANYRVIAIKPTTFMNNSGEAVQLVVNFYKIQLSNVIVLHDELDVDFGQIRTRVGGSSAGHNGVKSITSSLGDEKYGRVRIGIGPKTPKQIDSADFVLQKFNEKELSQLKHLTNEVSAILTEHLYGSEELVNDTRNFLI